MKIKMNKKGFTLIELLIVVAIIAILAAIAIPQFSAYRVRGYNAAADSDLRNIKIAEEAFFTDNQVYASSKGCPATSGGTFATACVGAVAGAGTITSGPTTATVTVAIDGITATQPAAPAVMVFGLSNGVAAVIATTAATAANYCVFTANTSGDTIYAGESGVTTLFKAGKDNGGAIVAVSSAAQKPGTLMTAMPVSATENPVVDLPTGAASFVAM
jgi:prepilin-type N-terminal cleavage/methylation domain-containing protein